MMRYCNSQTQVFPYADAMLRRDNPLVSFPRKLTDEIRAGYGVFPVVETPRPDVSAGQIAQQDAAPVLTDGTWVLGWTVRDMTAEELAEHDAQRRAAMTLTRGSFAVAAAQAGILTEREAEDWAGGNSLPAAVAAAINTALPQSERLAARIEALTASSVRRDNPIIALLQAALSLTDAQTDGLFA